jgi:hypothetical protein
LLRGKFTRHISKQNILTKRQNLIGYFHALGIFLLISAEAFFLSYITVACPVMAVQFFELNISSKLPLLAEDYVSLLIAYRLFTAAVMLLT